MFAGVIRSEKVTTVHDREVNLAVVIEVLGNNARWISADRITNRTRERNRSRRALVDEDRNSAIGQIRNCDVGLIASFAISAEVSQHQPVWICSDWNIRRRLKCAVAITFQNRNIIVENVGDNDVLLAVSC